MWNYLYFEAGDAVELISQDWNGAFTSWHNILNIACQPDAQPDLWESKACPDGSTAIGDRFCKGDSGYLVFASGSFWRVKMFVFEYGGQEAFYLVENLQDGSAQAFAYSKLEYVGGMAFLE
jgi:hypothetical protein